jgi:hypothetical protein
MARSEMGDAVDGCTDILCMPWLVMRWLHRREWHITSRGERDLCPDLNIVAT